ncbi:MAG: AtpZ/AtpI family protein [Rhodothermaceae bacterium]|nr:AtpZ/AtpI family protein [Rhodothermaceae bacterium]
MPSDSRLHEYARYSGIAVEISATMAVPVAVGYYADGYFDTHPWLLLMGIVLGLAGIIIYLYKLGIQSQQKPQSFKKNKQK